MMQDIRPQRSCQSRTIQSVDRAMTLLHLLASESEGLRLRDVASRLSLRPQTVQSLLRTLETWELVVQPERGGLYTLGPAALVLGRRWLAADGHAALARPYVEALSREVGEYVLLAELRGPHFYRLVECQGTQALTVRPELTPPHRIHRMATGKVLLAGLPKAQQEEVLKVLDFSDEGGCEGTRTDALGQQLAEARRQGYAVSVEENAAHVSAVAVPLDSGGQVHAALGISLPSVRFTGGRRTELLDALRHAARTIEQRFILSQSPIRAPSA